MIGKMGGGKLYKNQRTNKRWVVSKKRRPKA